MIFDPKIPYNDLPPLPPKVEVETYSGKIIKPDVKKLFA